MDGFEGLFFTGEPVLKIVPQAVQPKGIGWQGLGLFTKIGKNQGSLGGAHSHVCQNVRTAGMDDLHLAASESRGGFPHLDQIFQVLEDAALDGGAIIPPGHLIPICGWPVDPAGISGFGGIGAVGVVIQHPNLIVEID